MDLRHHRPEHDHDHGELLRIIVHNQHVIYERLNQMSASFQAQLDALTAVTVEVGDAIDNEIKQLAAAIAQPGVPPGAAAQVQASIDRLTTARDALKADDAPVA